MKCKINFPTVLNGKKLIDVESGFWYICQHLTSKSKVLAYKRGAGIYYYITEQDGGIYVPCFTDDVLVIAKVEPEINLKEIK